MRTELLVELIIAQVWPDGESAVPHRAIEQLTGNTQVGDDLFLRLAGPGTTNDLGGEGPIVRKCTVRAPEFAQRSPDNRQGHTLYPAVAESV